MYIYLYISQNSWAKHQHKCCLFFPPPFLRGTAWAFHLNSFTQSTLASYSWPRTTLQCSDCSECVPSWSLPLRFSMLSRDGESSQAVLGREPATFQGQNGWISEPRWELLFVLIKLKKTKEVCEQKLFHCCRELDVYPETIRVLIVLLLWKYELILNAMRWNEIDQHVRRVLIFVHEWSSTTSSLWEIKTKRQTFISFIVMSSLEAVSIGTAVYAGVCWIITAIVSSVLIRFDWSWLRIVARSFFFIIIILNLHLVPQSAACSAAAGKIHYDRRWTCHVDGGGEKTQTLQKKNFLFRTMTCFCRPFSSG